MKTTSHGRQPSMEDGLKNESRNNSETSGLNLS
jgi:hypothetical protein